MREINTKQQIEPLLNGELDLGVMRNTRLPEVLHYQLLLREPLVAVVPEGHPLAETPGGALRFNIWRRSRSCSSRAKWAPRCTTKYCCCSARQALPRTSPGSGEAMTIIGLVSAGLGGVDSAGLICPGAGGRRALFAAGGADATTEVWLVHHRRRPLTAAARALMALMLK